VKTIAAVVLAVIGTAIGFSLLPRSKAGTVPSAPVGRYAILHTYQNRVLMLDTATGAVWRFGFGDYCQSKTAPYDVRRGGQTEQCKATEDSISHIPYFGRVSVEGLYKTPVLAMIDAHFQAEAQAQMAKGVKEQRAYDRLKQHSKPKQ